MAKQSNMDSTPKQEEHSKRQERAERILDAASELMQRWGYRKTTIDDIARQAGVAKGTIYLHWKTREDLFRALLIRERLNAGKDLMQRMASDPEGGTLHGMVKHACLAALSSPLLKALMFRNTDVLGELAHGEFGKKDFEQRFEASKVYLELLRSKGMMRTDIDLPEQLQMLTAISSGFIMINQFLPAEYQISDEKAVEMMAETIKRTLEVRTPSPSEEQEFTTTFGQVFENVREYDQKELET